MFRRLKHRFRKFISSILKENLHWQEMWIDLEANLKTLIDVSWNRNACCDRARMYGKLDTLRTMAQLEDKYFPNENDHSEMLYYLFRDQTVNRIDWNKWDRPKTRKEKRRQGRIYVRQKDLQKLVDQKKEMKQWINDIPFYREWPSKFSEVDDYIDYEKNRPFMQRVF